MWRWAFVISWLALFIYGGGFAGLLIGFILLGLAIALAQVVIPAPQDAVSPAVAPQPGKVESEQGELVNARRGNPDPTRPAEWNRRKGN
jgi:hypothetical protein